jgi:hypothetical protein
MRTQYLVVGAAAAIALVFLMQHREQTDAVREEPRTSSVVPTSSPEPMSDAHDAVSPDVPAAQVGNRSAARDGTGDEPVAQTNDKVFRTDAAGTLILDAHTRLNLEALIARTPPSQLSAAKQEASALLPPAAAARAADLVDRYYEYDIAQRQSYPPGRAPSTEEEALAEIEGLHALREAHFGAEIAQAFYAEEEALNRRLLELMKLEKDQSLTLAEKAERAQRIIDR